MAGINGLTDEILKEAREKAERIIAAAKADAEARASQAEKDGEAFKERRASESRSRAEVVRARAESQAYLEKRQTLLRTRQEIIEGVIEKAYQRLLNQDDASYFDMIGKLLAKSVQPETGEICLSRKDLTRLPKDFAEKVSGIAASKGGSLTVSKEPADVDSGFILKYGGIEENCSLKALFDSMRNELTDKVNAVLW